jgi:hypothetical protein
MKTKTPYYRIDQALPPRHWYQKRVGWFGKTFLTIVTLSMIGAGSYGYVMNRSTFGQLAAQTSAPNKLRKVTTPISSDIENIIDVQYVLDKWAEEHPGETWSVSARGLEGPTFVAHLNQDKSYESTSIKHLLMTLPLYEQIPAEQHKSIKLESGKTMATCVNLMIRLGNTTCGTQVSEYIDYRKAADTLKKIGLTKTTIEGSKARTTAADVTTFLANVHSGNMQKNARDALVKSLREQRIRNGIPAACPGCVIANEASGNSATHDVAIIQYNGGTYVLSIFTKDGSIDQMSELAGKIQQKILDTLSD